MKSLQKEIPKLYTFLVICIGFSFIYKLFDLFVVFRNKSRNETLFFHIEKKKEEIFQKLLKLTQICKKQI